MSVIAVDITDHAVAVPAGSAAPGGAVWARVRPSIRRAHSVATDVLAALGKRRDLAGKGRNEHQDTHLAVAWLRAYDTTDLVLIDAQHLGSKVLGNIVHLAAAADVDLWLLHRAPTSDIFIRALNRHADATKTLDDVPPPTVARPRPKASASFPTVPRHDIHQFRTTVQATLSDTDRDTVLDRLDSATTHAYQQMTRTGATAATVRDLVDDLLLDAPNDDELITSIRGLQLAAWHHDVFLRVDLAVLLNSEERPTLPAAAVDDALRAYRQPHRIITVALTRRGHSLDSISGLRRSDISEGGRGVRIGGTTVGVPDIVARALRVATATATGERLIPHAPQTLAAVLTDATKDLGLHVKGRRAERTRPKHTAYLRRLGLTTRALP